MNATIQVATASIISIRGDFRCSEIRLDSRRIPAHVPQPMIVCSLLWREFWKMRKKTNRADTEAYRTPRKIRVGIMKENETFL